MFLNILCDFKYIELNTEFVETLFSFMIALLDGGNLKVQRTIANYFDYYSKSEILFANLNSILSEHSDFIIEEKNLSNRARNDSENEDNEEYLEKQKKNKILTKTLRLLQLFTEGHNFYLQNYMRFQINCKNNNDLVFAVVELLNSYSGVIERKVHYENILQCFDTLIEFIQGPCPQNQQAIIDGKFLSIANTILSLKTNIDQEEGRKSKKKSFIKPKNTQIENYMRERIKYKVFIYFFQSIYKFYINSFFLH